jgi:SAM-dependent methyltransferase
MAEPVNPDTAIALRPIHAFPPVRVSVFEDPADEKSSHGSQRYSGLISHFEGREPSWYESITREFADHERVLDLGAGPGLTLRAFSAHGVREPIGIDRWHGFLQDVDATGGRLILHDLTLPMPFLRSGSFDGIFSHFVLDYISPIGVVQTLREARRLLAPGGLIALHMNAAGLVLGDRVRTTPYDGPAVAELLASLGFRDVEVDQPETRRIIIVRARGGEPDRSGAEDRAEEPTVLECETDGEIQVSAGFRPKQENEAPVIAVEVVDDEGSIDYRPDLPSPPPQVGDEATVDVSICLRVVAVAPNRFELQAWTWQASQIAAIDRIGLQSRPQLLRVRIDGAVEHHDVWRPEPPMFEEPADAYATLEDAGPMLGPEDEWRARGRRVIVEREGDDRDLLLAVADSKDQFVVHRPDPEAPDIDALEEDWRAGQIHGVVLELEAAVRPESEPLLQWADSRGALVYLEPDSWTAVASAAEKLQGLNSPLLFVDPLLSGRAQAQAEVEVPEPLIATAALDEQPGLHLVLAESTARRAGSLWSQHANRVLMGKTGGGWRAIGDGRLADEATENLRYLTELTTLAWFRAVSGRSGDELGRYGRVAAAS